jgi:O-antigen/teichoic acid export membrane protein
MSIRRNTIYNLVGGLLPTVVAILSIPYLLANLGDEKFGVLTIIWALIGYVNLFDLGVSRSLTYEVSKLNSSSKAEISSTIVAGIFIALCTGAFGAALVFGGSFAFTDRWLQVDAVSRDDVHNSIMIISIAIMPVAVNTAIRGTLEGMNRFGAANLNRSIVGTLMFLLPAIAVALGHRDLTSASYYLLAGRVALTAFSFAQIWTELTVSEYRQLNSTEPLLRNFFRRVRKLLSYGIWIAITGVVGPLLTSGDRFVIARFVEVGLMPAYIIPQEGLQKMLLLPAALFGALFPRFTEMKNEEMRSVYWKYYKLTAAGMAVVCGGAAFLSYPILQWWISEQFAVQAYPITLVLCLGIWFNSMAQAPYTLLHAIGRPKTTAIFHLIELIVYCVVLVALLKMFGLIGAAYGWVFRVLLDLLLLHFAAARSLETGRDSAV